MNQLLLDINCDRRKCNLQLGASQVFVLNAAKRREALKYCRSNYLRNCFNSPNGEKIFQKCAERTMEAYPDVLNGDRKTLVTSPPQFEYNSRIKDTSTVVDEGLERIVNEKLYKNEEELKDINKFRSIYLPQAGERDVFSPLLSCFFHYRGLFLHGFEPSKYLNVFVSQAEYMRKEAHSKEAKHQVVSWMETIERRFPNPEMKFVNDTVSGIIVKDALDLVLKEEKGTENAIT